MKKKLFKNKFQMVTYIIIFSICIYLFILIGNTNFKKYEEKPAEKFSNIYNMVENDNVYEFSNATDILNILNGNSGIILLGFPSNKWTNYYATYLNEVAKDLNIDKIYYYDFLNDRKDHNGTYETIVQKLEHYVHFNDQGHADLNAPTVLIVKKGEIIGYFSNTSNINGNIKPEDYYTDYQIGETKELFKTAILEYLGE